MINVIITLKQVLILVIEIGVGYYFAKKGKIPSSSLGVLTFLCTTIALPCAIIYPVINLNNSPEVWKSLSTGVVIILACAVVQILVSMLLFRKSESKKKSVYQMATVYGNSAFMGIPLVTAILGSKAVIYATLMVIFDTVFLFAHASMAMSGQKPTLKFILRKVFGLATISLIIGLVILVSNVKLPAVITTCMVDLKGMMTPVAMLIVGAQLAQQDFKSIFKVPTHYVVSSIKLVIWPVLIMACLLPFKVSVPALAIVSIIICKATPQAAVLGVLADSNGLDGKTAAAVVGLTTILSIVTLPIICGIARAIFC